ncbi:MAG: (2Fe-2S) ferredoxin [Rhodospirillales bacterium]|nr:(2Fe-2S) ferredoxin [Rhodospirillales bacterium]
MRVTFIDPAGQTHAVTGEPGESIMRCATHHLVPGIVGECGGAMACATCHGYIAEDWAGKLAAPSAQEREMLSGCIDVRPNSRLTCQIRLTEELGGIVIEVPESQT